MASTRRASTKKAKPAEPPARSAAPARGGGEPKAEPKAADPVLERVAAEDLDLRDPAGRPSKGGPPDTGGVDEALAASQSDLAKLQKARRARVIKAIALTMIAIVFIIFILQNDSPMELRLLAWTVSVQLIWVIIPAALLGALAGYLVGRPPKHLLLHGPSRRQEDTR